MKTGRPKAKIRYNKDFRDWFKETFRSYGHAGTVLGVTRGAVHNWYKAYAVPSYLNQERIHTISNKRVTPESWMRAVMGGRK